MAVVGVQELDSDALVSQHHHRSINQHTHTHRPNSLVAQEAEAAARVAHRDEVAHDADGRHEQRRVEERGFDQAAALLCCFLVVACCEWVVLGVRQKSRLTGKTAQQAKQRNTQNKRLPTRARAHIKHPTATAVLPPSLYTHTRPPHLLVRDLEALADRQQQIAAQAVGGADGAGKLAPEREAPRRDVLRPARRQQPALARRLFFGLVRSFVVFGEGGVCAVSSQGGVEEGKNRY